MTPEKTTRQVTFMFEGQSCQGYEIHQGVSDTDKAILQTDHCIGTYIHGFLDNAPVIEHLLKDHGKDHGDCEKRSGLKGDCPRDLQAFKEEQYDKLADHIRQHVDIERIYQILTND